MARRRRSRYLETFCERADDYCPPKRLTKYDVMLGIGLLWIALRVPRPHGGNAQLKPPAKANPPALPAQQQNEGQQ